MIHTLAVLWAADGTSPGEKVTLYGLLIAGLLALLSGKVVPGWLYNQSLERIRELKAANEQLRQTLHQAVGTAGKVVDRLPPDGRESDELPHAPAGPQKPHDAPDGV